MDTLRERMWAHAPQGMPGGALLLLALAWAMRGTGESQRSERMEI